MADPGVARNVLSNKLGHLEKPSVPALTRLLTEGVAGLEGEKWVRHRRILNPALHLDKLKVCIRYGIELEQPLLFHLFLA